MSNKKNINKDKIKKIRSILKKNLIQKKDLNLKNNKNKVSIKSKPTNEKSVKQNSVKNNKTKNNKTKNKKGIKQKKQTKKINFSDKIKKKKDKNQKNKKSIKPKKKNKTTAGITNIKILSKPLCDTCVNVKSHKPAHFTSLSHEKWTDFPFPIPILGKRNTSQSVNINLGKENKNRLVYYFGSKQSMLQNTSKYPKSYQGSTNNGLVKLNNSGCTTIHLDCPVNYKDTPLKGTGLLCKNKKGNVVKNQGYMNHIHMIVSNKNMDSWKDKMYTTNVVCKINKEIYNIHLGLNNRIIINAIENKFNIQGTDCNIIYKLIKNNKKRLSELRKIIHNVANKKSKSHADFLKKKTVCNPKPVLDLPLTVYCHNPDCKASVNLIDLLYKAGFYNILYYPGGFMDYKGRL